MTSEEKIEQAFVSLIESMVPVQTLPAQVTAVDVEKATCDVEFIDKDLAPHRAVHLFAGTTTDTGLLIIPKLRSFVYVSIVNNNEQWAFVTLYTAIEEIRLRGDEFGGLIKINELVKRMNAIEKDLNTLKTAFKSWIVAPGDGGTALKLIATGWYDNNLPITKKQDFENTKVNHG